MKKIYKVSYSIYARKESSVFSKFRKKNKEVSAKELKQHYRKLFIAKGSEREMIVTTEDGQTVEEVFNQHKSKWLRATGGIKVIDSVEPIDHCNPTDKGESENGI